ncbi:ATP-binding cassette domain-containing protein [Magnetospirillum sp. SS-4]|uniref:ATP-binding cassette domain-containing protein n=1 Tax=Magnetospirillum sp. SS-4 TaxID=2681465 RepID=UPI00137C402C|nr:ATP-binding cassette domain-containing protein [Magnetospirillum sp. SS-4]CAA7619035.1 ABC transporter, transmembrane region [Magnetospirillum sp. SS-4]
MKLLIARMWASQRSGGELLLASILVNVLALVSSVYSIHVMNRYLAQGVDATLVTLTLGAAIAVIMEFWLRQARLRIAQLFCGGIEREYSGLAYSAFGTARFQLFEQIPLGQRREALAGLATIQQGINGGNLAAILDGPFALLFIAVLSLLSPTLGLLALAVALALTAFIFAIQRSMTEPAGELVKHSVRTNGLAQFLSSGTETIRAFNCYSALQRKWDAGQEDLAALRRLVQRHQNLVQQLTQSATTVLTIGLFAVGAREVIAGDLNVGSLIGASILGTRALASIGRVAQLAEPLEKARHAIAQLEAMAKLPTEKQQGSVPRTLKGEVQSVDLSFRFPGHPLPLFEGLDFMLRPGGVMAVVGSNGTGKTTFAKLLVGLLEPDRGHLKIDGMDLRHLVPEWWRQQLIYLPQEPVFFDGTLRENLTVLAPGMEDSALLELCNALDLGDYLDSSPDGLDMAIRGNGAMLPLGIRRRFALVRGLVGGGKVAILDEPTEGVDAQGCQAIARQLNEMVRRGCTVIVMTKDEFIIRAAEMVLDLNQKPTPRLVTAPTGAASEMTSANA